MKNTGRREQIFAVCSHLYKQGYTDESQYTYRAMHTVCDELGYPRGNQKSLAKYRDEWFSLHLKKGPVDERSANTSLLQSTLDALLQEHKQKLTDDFQAQYSAKLDKLHDENRHLLSVIDLREEELAESNKKVNALTERLEGQQGYFDSLHKECNRQHGEKDKLSAECAVLHEKVATLKTQLKEERDANQGELNNLIQAHSKKEADLNAQIVELKRLLESTTQTLTASFDKREQELVSANEKLGEQLAKLQSDYHALDKDYARQEHSISLLERERGEFYQEFTVMRKQFEQIPKYQSLAKDQEELIGLMKEMNKQLSPLKSSKK